MLNKIIYTVALCILSVDCSADSGNNNAITYVDGSYIVNGFSHNFEGCTNDVDCANGGEACGTSVCSWANPSVHLCVAVSSGDPGWCGDPNLDQAVANTTCKCFNKGATCNMVSNFCSKIK